MSEVIYFFVCPDCGKETQMDKREQMLVERILELELELAHTKK